MRRVYATSVNQASPEALMEALLDEMIRRLALNRAGGDEEGFGP